MWFGGDLADVGMGSLRKQDCLGSRQRQVGTCTVSAQPCAPCGTFLPWGEEGPPMDGDIVLLQDHMWRKEVTDPVQQALSAETQAHFLVSGVSFQDGCSFQQPCS